MTMYVVLILKSTKKILHIVLVMMLVCFSGVASSKSIGSSHLKIIYKAEKSKKYESIVKKSMEQMWLRACKRIGVRLKEKKSLFGFGVFRSYSCFIDEKKLYGKRLNTDWALEFTDLKSSSEFEIKFKDRTQSMLKLPATTEMFYYMHNKGFADILSFRLLNQLPMVTSFKHEDNKANKNFRSLYLNKATKHQAGRYSPPKSLILYYLDYDEEKNIWLAEVIGKAKLKEQSNSKIIKGKHRFGNVSWSIELNDGAEPSKRKIWAHSEDGRGLLDSPENMSSIIKYSFDQLEIETGRKKASLLERIAFLLRDTTASGYIGLRYGAQVLAGDSLLGNSNFIGLLVEIRGGPLEGLRIYHDTVPKVVSEIEGKKIELNWKRTTLGAAFGFNPGYVFDRIDIVPKFGQWTFNAALPLNVEEGVVVQRFDVENRLSFAIEVGFEVIKTWATFRFWGGQDKALSLGGLETSGVTTTRYGIDTFFTLGSKVALFGVPIQFNVLGFGVIESVGLTASDDAVSENDEYRIESVAYDSGYLGTGIAVSW